MREIAKLLEERHRINQLIRLFFISRGYIEVETPTVVQSPGMEPNLDPFETVVSKPDETKYFAGLITSPEYSMKKILAKGMEKIFTICKVFRNKEEFGGSHNSEFTLLEWYSQGVDYQICMNETEELIKICAKEFGQDLSDFHRVRVRDLFLENIGIDLDNASKKDLQDVCKKLDIRTDESDTESDLFYRLFLEKIEPNFGEDPIFIYDYPAHQAALSQKTTDGKYGQRFELYWKGLELCNGYTELVDEKEQRKRFEEEISERSLMKKRVWPIDEELISALPKIKNPTFGNALGIDRLHMALIETKEISDTIALPIKQLFNNSIDASIDH